MIFAIGTVWFWLMVIIGFIVVTYCIEQEEPNGWHALWTCLFIGAGLYFLGSREAITNALQYVIDHPMRSIFAGLTYFVFGTVWSIFKWYFFLKEQQRKDKWPTKTVYEDAADKSSFKARESRTVKIPFQAKDYRSDILMWMTWWPFSAFWTIINDPVRKAFEWIFDRMEGTFNRISQRVFDSTQPKQ